MTDELCVYKITMLLMNSSTLEIQWNSHLDILRTEIDCTARLNNSICLFDFNI
jgi:hypothetical protein